MTNHLCALLSLYIQTLKRPWSIADTPYPRSAIACPPFSVKKKEHSIDACRLLSIAPF